MIDAAIRMGYRVAHLGLRTWWFVRRPETRGALVAIWNEGQLLLIRSSYRSKCSLPGGYVEEGEDPKDAAVRELWEELALRTTKDALREGWKGSLPFEFRTDSLHIFELDVDHRPEVKVNQREIIWAGWKTAKEALEMDIVPHLREYLATK